MRATSPGEAEQHPHRLAVDLLVRQEAPGARIHRVVAAVAQHQVLARRHRAAPSAPARCCACSAPASASDRQAACTNGLTLMLVRCGRRAISRSQAFTGPDPSAGTPRASPPSSPAAAALRWAARRGAPRRCRTLDHVAAAGRSGRFTQNWRRRRAGKRNTHHRRRAGAGPSRDGGAGERQARAVGEVVDERCRPYAQRRLHRARRHRWARAGHTATHGR